MKSRRDERIAPGFSPGYGRNKTALPPLHGSLRNCDPVPGLKPMQTTGRLAPERKKLLDEIGFVWRVNSRR